MAEKLNEAFEFLRWAFGSLHGVGSPIKIVILAAIFGLVVLGIVITGILDIVKKVKEKHESLMKAEEKHPRFFRFVYSGKVRSFFLLVVVLLLVIDWRDVTAIGPISGTIRPPSPPIVNFVDGPKPDKLKTVQAAVRSPHPSLPSSRPGIAQSLTPQSPGKTQATAREKAEDALNQVDSLSQSWTNTTDDAQRIYAVEMGNGVTMVEAQATYQQTIDSAWSRITNSWNSVIAPAISSACHDALLVMESPGRNQLTSDQMNGLRAGCQTAMKAPDAPKPAEIINRNIASQRFDPAILFLRELVKELGNYPPIPTPQP